MEEEILKQIVNEYKEQQQKKEKYSKIKDRINELAKTKEVKEYLELINLSQNLDYKRVIDINESDIIINAFRRNSLKITTTNEIYVYLGTFKLSNVFDIEHGPSDERVERDSNQAEYRIYRDIEKCDSIEIPIKQCEEFEKNNKIVFPRTIFKEKYYYELQKEFLEDSVLLGQEVAYTRILRKVNQNNK